MLKARLIRPVWVLLAVILVSGSIISGILFLPGLLAAKPDFTLIATPSSSQVLAEPGGFARANVTLTATNNFTGVVNPQLSTPAGVRAYFNQPGPVGPFPFANQATLNVILSATAPGSYVITVTATSGKLSHSIQLSLNARDLSITFNPSNLTVSLGIKRNATLTISSVNGLSGRLAVTTMVPSPFAINGNTVNATIIPPIFTIDSGKSVTTTLVVGGGYDPGCAYTCLWAQDANIQLSVAVQGLTGSVVGSFPVVMNESAAIANVSFLSSTYANVTLRNTGPDAITYTNYTVTNQVGSAYSFLQTMQYAGEGRPTGSLFSANIVIGASCGACTLRGTPFTYVTGQSYIVTIETIRGNILSFTIVR